jgi:hypothetical protein
MRGRWGNGHECRIMETFRQRRWNITEDQTDNKIPDVLGSVAFTPVKNDMLGNVKVRFPRNLRIFSHSCPKTRAD